MHFKILNESLVTVWESDPVNTNQVTVAVSNGIYTVKLGDTTLANMAALTTVNLDKNQKLSLRVRVGTEDLSPDILLSAVPFAYIAKQAETVTQNISAGKSVALALRQSTQNVGLFNTNPTGIFQVSSNYLFVSSNGNIGVSTTNPQEILDLTGRIRLGQTTAPGTVTDKLYNVSGNLFWNGVTLNVGPGSGTNYWSISGSNIFYPSGNVGVTSTAPTNLFQVSTNYLVVSSNGRVGIGNSAPANLFQVSTNALVVSANGNVGISTANTSASLVIDGGLVIAPSSTVSLTADNQLVTVGNRSFIIISSNTGVAANRTFCLTAGRMAGHILYIFNTNNGNSAQLVDGAQTCAGGPVATQMNGSYSFGGGGDTITLIYDGATWSELGRGTN
jgi:hypothetical protein